MKRKMVWITAVLPLIAAAIAYGRLPDIIPIHWGLNGEVNGTAPKPMIFLVGAVGIFMTVILLVMAKIDPKHENIQKKQRQVDTMIIVINLVILVIMGMTITEAIHPNTLDVGQIAAAIVGVMFVVIGNYLPKIGQNYSFGVRTAWALNDEENWKISQKFGGWAMFIGGLMILAGAFLLPPILRFALVFAVAIVILAGTYLVSYLYYRKKR